MEAVLDTTLAKWGNSQGFRVPKEACELLGISLGSKAKMSVDTTSSSLLLTFEQPERKFHRTRKLTAAELFKGYKGVYEPPADWPTIGNEIDWGDPVGNEVW